MTTVSITTALEEIGLDNRSQRTYLALMELGVASVQTLAKQAGLERTGVYGILRALAELGLVSESTLGKKRAFTAESPLKLLAIQRRRTDALTAVMPELQSHWNTTDLRPKQRLYEGAEGMRTVLEDTLTVRSKELLGILSAKDLFHAVGERWFEGYTKKRIDTGLKLRVVRSKEREVGKRWPSGKQFNRELRWSPESLVFTTTIYVYDNKVAILSTKRENFGLIIESDEYAQTQRLLFEALWQLSTPDSIAPKQTIA